MSRGRFRVYLGAAPGVGTTSGMLREGRRAAEGGTDVVGFVAAPIITPGAATRSMTAPADAR